MKTRTTNEKAKGVRNVRFYNCAHSTSRDSNCSVGVPRLRSGGLYLTPAHEAWWRKVHTLQSPCSPGLESETPHSVSGRGAPADRCGQMPRRAAQLVWYPPRPAEVEEIDWFGDFWGTG